MSSSPHKTLNHLLTYFFAALFFFTPLILWPNTSELFEFNKMMFVYFMTILILTTWSAQWILAKQITIPKTPLDLPIFLFFLSQVLATIFSINLHTSLWGYYSRFHGGLVSTISYITLYYAFVAHFTHHKRELLKLLEWSILGSALLVVVYGILEHFGIDKDIWVQDVQNRVFSTLGQPNWLSAYLVALFPLSIAYAFTKQGSSSTFKSLLWYLLPLSFFVTILFTKSRSGIGATLIVLFITSLYFLAQTLKSKTPKLILLPLLCLITITLIGSPWTPNPSQISQRLDLGGQLWPEAEKYLSRIGLTSQIKPLEVNRLPAITQDLIQKQAQGERVGGSDSFEIRKVVWEGAIDLVRRKPLFGTGVETFGYTYYWTRPAAHNLLSEWDFLYNKAHNEYLNFLATTGIVGFTTYSLLIIWTLVWWLKLLLKTKESTSSFPLLSWSLLLGYVSILITNYFGFSVVPVALFFFLFPAIIYADITPDLSFYRFGSGTQLTKKDLKRSPASTSTSQYLLLTLILIPTCYSLFTLFQHWLADIKYNKGKAYNQAGYIAAALPLLDQATKLYPTEPIIRSELSEAQARAAVAISQQLQTLTSTPSAQFLAAAKQQQQGYIDSAQENIDKVIAQNPWHLNFWKSKTQLELTLATLDRNHYPKALESLLRANELAPTDAKILYNIGLIHLQMGDKEKARVALSKAIELKNDYHAAIQQLNGL